MDVQLVITSLVRQTTVLLAQVATSAGVRAPLAQVANHVFLDLARELERQGVGRKVVADMFGLALRSYQQKVQRLTESATDSGLTLWEAVYEYLRQQEVVSRARVLERFARDDEASVKSVVKDLVATGLVYKTGRGDDAVYRLASRDDLRRASGQSEAGAAAFVWTLVYRSSPITGKELEQLSTLDAGALSRALDDLVRDGRIRRERRGEEWVYSAEHCHIPLGASAGWEAALLDHHRAVIGAICAKLQNGQTRALAHDRVGRSTYTFEVWPGHPHEQEAYGLLSELRQRLGALWDAVTDHNRGHEPPEEGAARVTLYCGQFIAQ